MGTICVKNNFLFPCNLPDFLDGLYGSGFVIAVHNGHQNGILGDGFGNILRIDPPAGVDRKGCYHKSARLQAPQASNNPIVLDIGGNDMLALILVGQGHTFDGMIDRFGPSGGEDNFFGRFAIQQTCHCLTGRL
jgi:hypothetical protein